MNKCVLGLEACMFIELRLWFKFLRQVLYELCLFCLEYGIDNKFVGAKVCFIKVLLFH